MAKGAYIGVQNFVPRELPEGYTQLEYIETNGDEYIDTGIVLDVNSTPRMKVVADMAITDTSTTIWRVSGVGAQPPVFYFGISGNGNNVFAYGDGSADVLLSTTANNERHIWILDAKNKKFSISNTLVNLDDIQFSVPSNSPYSRFIISGYVENPTSTIKLHKERIYAYQFYDDDILIRDYVPCLNPSGQTGLYDCAGGSFYGNAGAGAFITGSTTPTETAQKIAKGYFGVSSLARKIKKAYIGIGGVARPCWAGGELTYYGTVTGLSKARQGLAATTVGDYALFGGGSQSFRGDVVNTVDAYNTSLVRTIPFALSQTRVSLGAATIGNYALFAGGDIDDYASGTNRVDAYDASLTRTTATSLSVSRYGIVATSIGNYALFAGGNDEGNSDKNTVDAYNASLTRTIPSTLNVAGIHSAATTVGQYALFGAVFEYNRLTAYDSSLTRTTATMSKSRGDAAAASVKKYALIVGGAQSEMASPLNDVDAYDASLTQITPMPLSTARTRLAATSFGGYALFGGGYKFSGIYYDVVEAYDDALTKTIITPLNSARSYLSATSIGDFALFGGGLRSSGAVSTVDAYTFA